MQQRAADAPWLLGVDLGTTGAKAVLVDASDGGCVGSGYAAYGSATDTAGRHEQDPEDWWSATVAAVRGALSGRDASRVAAVGLSGHMHGVVLVDGSDRVVRPALTWADRRCMPQVRRLREAQETFTSTCLNPVVEAFVAPKVAWLAEEEPQSLERAVRLVQAKDVLRHRLTGSWGTDLTDARGTLLHDYRTTRWDDGLWRLCGADPRLAPEVAASTAVVGAVTRTAAGETGLAQGTPVVAGAGDVACSALGAGVVGDGTVYVNAGTAAQVLAAMEEPLAGDHFVFGRAASERYLAMASVYAAGLSVDWAARLLLSGGTGDQPPGAALDAMAAADPAGAGGAVFVPHLLGTSVPTHDPSARAALTGLAAGHGAPAIARAVLEGVAYACAAAVRHVAAVVGGSRRLRVGGGLARSQVWREALSAVHTVPVERVAREPSPVGAAMLAGVGAGLWADVQAASAVCVHAAPVQPPAPAAVAAHQQAQERYETAAALLQQLGEPSTGVPTGSPEPADGRTREATGATR